MIETSENFNNSSSYANNQLKFLSYISLIDKRFFSGVGRIQLNFQLQKAYLILMKYIFGFLDHLVISHLSLHLHSPVSWRRSLPACLPLEYIPIQADLTFLQLVRQELSVNTECRSKWIHGFFFSLDILICYDSSQYSQTNTWLQI